MVTKTDSVKKPPKTKAVVEGKMPSKIAYPLIVEPHPKEYIGFPFITLIQYRKAPMLVIVDNIDDSVIKAYVLDLCGPERVDEQILIQIAAQWYENDRNDFPLSIAFSRQGITPITSKILRALNIEFVSRVIGPVPCFPMNKVSSIKRRRRKQLPTELINQE